MESMVVDTARGSGTAAALAPPIPLGDPVLDAAVAYFGKHGLRFAALEEVARSCDLDVREVRRRYSSSRSLAVGIFDRVLDILGEQLDRPSEGGSTLTERLQRRFELELRLLEPCKPLVRSWLIDSANPLSPSALLQGPLAFRYVAQIEQELEVARKRGEIYGWILPVVAAGVFICIRGRLVLGWLGDDSPAAARTVALARAEIAAFARLLAPGPLLEGAKPSNGPSTSAHGPRALSASIEVTAPSLGALSPPTATAGLPGQPASEPVQTAAATVAAPPTVAMNAAISSVPVVLGALAHTTPAAELEVSRVLEAAPESEPTHLDSSAPAPVKPGSEMAPTRSKNGSRTKRARH
ncbi:MAG TPA: hypothetical protein VNN80_32855 [Polyangiaceae bacterium]|nr:hypothetical protein [Polyangiaceae bacterium]